VSLKIRLKRAGSKKRPFYRVVVTDSRRARDSRSIEDIGYYNPLEDPVVVNVDRDKVAAWTKQGATASETVQALLRRENTAHASRRDVPDFSADAPRVKPAREVEGEKRGKGRGKARDAAPAAATAVAEAPAPEAPAVDEGPSQAIKAPAEGPDPKPES